MYIYIHVCKKPYLVAKLEVKVAGLRVIAKINPLSVVSDDVLCTRVLVVATGNQFLHPETKGSTS